MGGGAIKGGCAIVDTGFAALADDEHAVRLVADDFVHLRVAQRTQKPDANRKIIRMTLRAIFLVTNMYTAMTSVLDKAPKPLPRNQIPHAYITVRVSHVAQYRWGGEG